jgi:geranyl-CoA carboxylase alpha subunit
MSFSKILIANRGEIACRVVRTARALGYSTVAVFSDADRHAPHAGMADEAVHIGPSTAADSYLSIDRILDAAKRTGAQAVHPGYGFLSENAGFAKACVDAGLVFIGPPAESIKAMGDKALAKQRMLQAGVPCAPGYLGEKQDDASLTAAALKLGFPLLVKAVAGGGGRGMRLAHKPDDVAQALAGARREAISAFGDGTLMLERLIDHGRHIEIQVFADAHGNAVYLGERDCTAQRRRQKVIEEAPSPVVSPAMREAMGRDAVAAALAVGYRGAGTVEFIVDANLKHYFLEMNTRLQVEHPVTEMVTGLDLVEWQIRVAQDEPLPLRQDQIQLHGHAIEVRLYAEDPYAAFAPQTGKVLWWRPQDALQPGVRVDSGVREGGDVSPYYDPMVAKLMAYGRDRPEAIRRLRQALAAAPMLGLRNNGSFLSDLLDHRDFRGASMTTTLIDQWADAGAAILQRPVADDQAWCLAAALLALSSGAGWRPDSVSAFDMSLDCDGASRAFRVSSDLAGRVSVQTGGLTQVVQIDTAGPVQNGLVSYEMSGVRRKCIALLAAGSLHLALDGAAFVFREPSAFPQSATGLDPRRACAPVAGKVTQVLAIAGAEVAEGQMLVCIEAMKMEMWVSAQVGARVGVVHVRVGEQVESGALLVELQPAADAPAA